ncbi:hypothetical protein RDI58_007332 [Solanum bulbocastanum]|uniref:Uncharacterized protein n=1 Tax=Solanum bulbocastanum TaxID=147425 RepID=A0AAN8TW87_SOLBU
MKKERSAQLIEAPNLIIFTKQNYNFLSGNTNSNLNPNKIDLKTLTISTEQPIRVSFPWISICPTRIPRPGMLPAVPLLRMPKRRSKLTDGRRMLFCPDPSICIEWKFSKGGIVYIEIVTGR